MNCEECESSPAQTYCEACGQSLCLVCDESLHKRGKRQAHQRSALPTRTARPTVTLYWDMASLAPRSVTEVQSVLARVKNCYGEVREARAYAQTFLKLGKEIKELGFELVTRQGVPDYDSLIMDVTLRLREDSGKVLILTGSATRMKPFLCELTTQSPKDSILVASSTEKLAFTFPAEIKASPVSYTVTSKVKQMSQDLTAPRKKAQSKDLVPVFHQWTRHATAGGIESRLVDFLKSYANQGKVMTEVSTLISGFQHYAIVKAEQARTAIQAVQSAGLIHVTNRTFGALRTVNLISLQAESLSLELLLWTLRSLKNDEMLPTERAIQSRMKEAFDVKPTVQQWQVFMEAVAERSKHHHSLSAPEAADTLTAQLNIPTCEVPNFVVLDVMDALTNLEAKVIYPDGERWLALDNSLKPGDSLQVTTTDQWQSFISFLESHFEPEVKAWPRSEEDKAIAGGRYGCAQFLKFCGPAALQSCSLGRLSCMVQMAINDDILRYQKTLLVWTAGKATQTPEEVVAERLKQAKNAIIETLLETIEGVSLAQLPMKLKAFLPFPLDLNELGFAKLKDLLATIPNIKIEQRGSNHPFAVYIGHSASTSASDADFQTVLSTIHTIVGESRLATPAGKLETSLTQRLGRVVNWSSFDCANISDFARKWGSELFEVAPEVNPHVMLKQEGHFYSLSDSSPALPLGYQRSVMISDLPEEFRSGWTGSDLPPACEAGVEEADWANGPPFSSDSVEFHSANPSYTQIDWSAHVQTLSRDFDRPKAAPPGFEDVNSQ